MLGIYKVIADRIPDREHIRAIFGNPQLCITDIQQLPGFKSAMRTRIGAGSEFHLKALEALVIDTLKKKSETSKKLAIKRATKRARQEDPSDDEEEDPDAQEVNAVAIWLTDPCDGSHKVGGE